MPTTDDEPAIINPLEGSLDYELRRTSVAAMSALTKALEPLNLRPSEATLLTIVGANPGCTQSEVARASRAQPANLVPLINRLMVTGSILREPSAGRALSLYLTDQGQVLLERVNRVFAHHEAQLSQQLSAQLRESLPAALRTICHNACHATELGTNEHD